MQVSTEAYDNMVGSKFKLWPKYPDVNNLDI